jgi:hypothetical protein
MASELGRTDWELLQPDTREAWRRRARGDRGFIHPADRPATIATDAGPLARSIPEPEIRATLVNLEDLGCFDNRSGPYQLRKLLVENGWSWYATFARGPWVTASGKMSGRSSPANDARPDSETEPVDELTVEGIADSIFVWARRDGVRIRAGWVRRPWLKNPTAWKRESSKIEAAGRGLVTSDELKAFIKAPPPPPGGDAA